MEKLARWRELRSLETRSEAQEDEFLGLSLELSLLAVELGVAL